jgi:hypothetical protein
MEKMFSYVDIDYTEEFCKKPFWFHERSWTTKEEESFKDWLVWYLKNNYKMTIKKAKKEADFFLLSYGWKTI